MSLLAPRASVAAPQTLELRSALAVNLSPAEAEGWVGKLATEMTTAGEIEVAAAEAASDLCLADAACARALLEGSEAEGLVLLVLRSVGGVVDVEPTLFLSPKRFEELPRFRIETSSPDREKASLTAGARSLLDALEVPARLVEDDSAPLAEAPSAPAVAPPPAPARDEVKASEPAPLVLEPAPEMGKDDGLRPPVLVAASVAAALGAGSLVLGILAKVDESGLEADNCEVIYCDPGRVDAMEAKATASDVLVAGALLSAALSGVLHVVLDGSSGEETALFARGSGLEVRF